MSISSFGVLRTPSRMLMITKGAPASTTAMIGPTLVKPRAKPRNRA